MIWPKLKTFLLSKLQVPVWLLLALGGVGLLILVVVLWPASGSREWLQILVDDQGKIDGVVVQAGRIPREVLAALPNPQNKHKLNRAQIKKLAEEVGLYQDRLVNPHLVFEDWVIDWWSKQIDNAWEMELQFLSRRLVLEAADRKGAYIANPGDLSHWSERLYPYLKKRTLEGK